MNRIGIFLLLGLLAMGGALSAQPMSGSYTLGPAAQYTSFQAAADDVALRGVSGPVTFLVAPGIYNESFTLKYVPTASAVNTITFQSIVPLMAKLNGTTGPTLTFEDGTSAATRTAWYIIDGFEFTSGPDNAILANRDIEDITIKNCEFKAAHATGLTGTNLRLINAAGGSLWRFHIHDNVFEFIPNGRGFHMSQCSEWLIYRNVIDLNGVNIGFYTINTNSAKNQFFNNIFHGALQDTATSNVIDMSRSQYDINITHNTFIVDTGTAPARILYGRGCCTTRMIYVYNNIFVNLGAGPCIMWRTQAEVTNFYRGDGNLFWRPGSTPVMVAMIGTSTATGTPYDLTGWQTAAAGYDTVSMVADPLLIPMPVPRNIVFASGSPAAGAAAPYLANPSYPLYNVTEDFFGTQRGALPSIGAYEPPGAGFFTSGAGCPGTGSVVPTIGHTGTAAIGGADFNVTVGNALGGAPALLLLGITNVSFGPVPLPYDFGGGCNLYQDLVSFFGAALAGTGAGNGAGSQPLPIPNDPALAGGNIFFQWLVVDSGAPNTLGVVSTDGGRLSL